MKRKREGKSKKRVGEKDNCCQRNKLNATAMNVPLTLAHLTAVWSLPFPSLDP